MLTLVQFVVNCMANKSLMGEFRNGDFIRLKNINKYHISRVLDIDVNIFKTINIKDGFIEVEYCENKIPASEIEPIPINGKDDFQIYYDPIVMSAIVGSNDTTPMREKDYPYYYDSFKSCYYENKNFQELIKEIGLQYVHEVQHFLFDQFQDKGLKINAY